jgi:hypothetical protein
MQWAAHGEAVILGGHRSEEPAGKTLLAAPMPGGVLTFLPFFWLLIRPPPVLAASCYGLIFRLFVSVSN